MKTAISIPDALFEQAEVVARELSLSRSELYATALETFLQSCYPVDVTAKLNDVYVDQPSTVDAVLLRLQMSSLPRELW
jgi:hypothetical protein